MALRILRADRRGPAVIAGVVADAHAAARAVTDAAERAGRERAMQAARAELAAERLKTQRARLEALEASGEQVRELALLAAQHLVQAELSLKPERITEIVESLLARVRRAQRAVVRVHPDDIAELTRFRQQAQLAHVELEADDSLARGGCVVTTPIGTLDASIETRIEALRRALAEAAKTR